MYLVVTQVQQHHVTPRCFLLGPYLGSQDLKLHKTLFYTNCYNIETLCLYLIMCYHAIFLYQSCFIYCFHQHCEVILNCAHVVQCTHRFVHT